MNLRNSFNIVISVKLSENRIKIYVNQKQTKVNK